MAHILGLDGGGTKTHCILYDTFSGKYEFLEYGSTSHEQLFDSTNGVKNQLIKIIDDAVSSNGIKIDDLDYATFGLAGIDTTYQLNILKKIIGDIGIKNFTLCNDAYLGIKAGSKKGYGICLINGTGFNIVGINEADSMFQSGSQFELTGDYGGGLILGKEAIKTVYLNLYRERKATILNDIILSDFGITSKEDYMEVITRNIAEGKVKIPHFAKYIFDAANSGDDQCIEILKRVGREYALSIKTLLEELVFDNCEIDLILAGSLFTKKWNEISVISLIETLEHIVPDRVFKLSYLKVPPVFGALAWSCKKLFNNDILDELVDIIV